MNQFTAYLVASDRYADRLRALGTFNEETADFELHPTAELASLAAAAGGWSDEHVFSVTVEVPDNAVWLVEFEPFGEGGWVEERYTDFEAAYRAATVGLTPEHYRSTLTGILCPRSTDIQAINSQGDRVMVAKTVEWVLGQPAVRLGTKVVAQ